MCPTLRILHSPKHHTYISQRSALYSLQRVRFHTSWQAWLSSFQRETEGMRSIFCSHHSHRDHTSQWWLISSHQLHLHFLGQLDCRYRAKVCECNGQHVLSALELERSRTQLELHVCKRVWVYDDLTGLICVVAGVYCYFGWYSWSVFNVQSSSLCCQDDTTCSHRRSLYISSAQSISKYGKNQWLFGLSLVLYVARVQPGPCLLI